LLKPAGKGFIEFFLFSFVRQIGTRPKGRDFFYGAGHLREHACMPSSEPVVREI